MARTQIRTLKIRQWFPPGDTLATAVATLCILREDLLLEMYGMANDSIDRLDDNGSFYRRTYFLRNSFRTLEEIKKVLSRLSVQEAFKDALSREPKSVQTAFADLSVELNTA